MKYKIFSFLILLLLVGCGQNKFTSKKEYYNYINVQENGLIKFNTGQSVSLVAKFLPSELLALEESAENNMNTSLDSLIHAYNCSKTFLVTIKSINENLQDPIYYNIDSEEKLKERQQAINFRFGENFRLKCGGQEFSPNLFYANCGNGLTNNIVVKLVFVAETEDSPLMYLNDFDLIYFDPFFDTGISHFKFETKDLLNIPKL